jgi:hypothetical protein
VLTAARVVPRTVLDLDAARGPSDDSIARAVIRRLVADFLLAKVTPTNAAQIWCYYGSYDMVALAQLFGRMIDLPKGIPMYCMDLKQLSVEVGSPEHPKQINQEHDALDDARWNKQLFEFLRTTRTPC